MLCLGVSYPDIINSRMLLLIFGVWREGNQTASVIIKCKGDKRRSCFQMIMRPEGKPAWGSLPLVPTWLPPVLPLWETLYFSRDVLKLFSPGGILVAKTGGGTLMSSLRYGYTHAERGTDSKCTYVRGSSAAARWRIKARRASCIQKRLNIWLITSWGRSLILPYETLFTIHSRFYTKPLYL